MSYGIRAGGTPADVRRYVTVQCDGNTSPEMPTVKAFLHALLDAVSGDDKCVIVEANGWHSNGMVQHSIRFDTFIVPPEPTGDNSASE